MRKKATMSMQGHGQMLAGKLKALISTENQQGLLEHEGEGQCIPAHFVRGRCAGAHKRVILQSQSQGELDALLPSAEDATAGSGRSRENCDEKPSTNKTGSLGFGGVAGKGSRIWQKQEDCNVGTTA